ncbi:MAG: PolC-type DNA polymerase III [Bacillota bacterium]|jgi:DNA polymerase-3 subunit alpha (Gram-positive type)|nr:PolC-type DNA polymerase III [Bacillota bacterium]HOA91854.1 PolC-type DNA polymerase III [Bacillota bacterium]HPZ73135.1 PolC-type DNA polymerase III [Bacillota bacterium]
MATYIIEPNEEKCRKLLPDLPVRIVRVVVDEERGRLEVDVRSHTELDFKTKQKIRDAIKSHIPEARTINVCCWLEDSDYTGDKPKPVKPKVMPNTGQNSGSRPDAAEQGGGRRRARRSVFESTVTGTPVKLSEISEELPSVTVYGRICSLERREFKTGRTLLTLDVTDYTSTYPVKVFLDKDAVLPEFIKEGCWVLLEGRMEYDTYSRGLVIYPNAINEAEPKERIDGASAKRVELHLHTKLSSLDAVVDPQDVLALAKTMGHDRLAVTDHGTVQAFPEFYKRASKFGVKVLYGVEGYLANSAAKEEPTYHIIVLVKNQKGMFNLYKLVSLSHIESFYRHPRMIKETLCELREGLILGSACEAGELYQAILHKRNYYDSIFDMVDDEAILEIARFYDYLEIQPLGNNAFMIRENIVSSFKELEEINTLIYRIGKALDIPVVATGDVHFLNPEDEVFRRVLLAGQGYQDAANQPPLYYRTTEEMLEEFRYLGEEAAYEVVVTNTNLIADMIEDVKPISDEFCPPVIEGAEKAIEEMTYKKAYEIYGENLPTIVKERLEKELKAIISNGFAVLYLIANKLVLKSLEDGYLVGSRGSVGSSLVATMCDITEVNPLPPHYICPECHHFELVSDPSYGCGVDLPEKDCPSCGTPLHRDGFDIPFEIFMGFEGDKVPDIDLNFSGVYQSTIHKYTEELFGKDHVFRAGTIGTLAEKTAYGFVAKYLEESGTVWPEAEINRVTRALVGIRRTTGQHPGGMVVVPEGREIYEFTPIQHPANDSEAGFITTHFDFHSIDENLVKLDILGHDDPTMLRMLADLTGLNPTEIPLDDPKTMALFTGVESLGLEPEDIGGLSVGVLGIPEFGTSFVRRMVEEIKPTSFAELIRISGFSHGTDVWTNNAQDLIRNGIADAKDAIATRDDIMNFLIQKGMEPKKAFSIMERVRKGRGLSDEDVSAMEQVGIPQWYIESCRKISYLFPKAHAVAYVIMAFRIAYFKVHYPEAYYAAFFSIRASEFPADSAAKGVDAVKMRLAELKAKGSDLSEKEAGLVTSLEIVLEALQRGIVFREIDLYESDAFAMKITPTGLLPPLSALDGVGAAAAEALAAAASTNGEFRSIQDLQEKARVSRAVIDALRSAGCLEGLPETDQMSLF